MKKMLIAAASGLMFAVLAAPAFAQDDAHHEIVMHGGKDKNKDRDTRPTVAAPEIDVTAGSKGIAALIAGLLLAAEGLRRRR